MSTNPFTTLEATTGAAPRVFVAISRYINVAPSLHVAAMRPHTIPARPATRRSPAVPSMDTTVPTRGLARKIPEGATLDEIVAMGEDIAAKLADLLVG